MSGNEEGASLPSEGRLRVATAWLSWWFMLSSGGVITSYALIFIALLAIGGVGLVADVWAEKEKNNNEYTKIIVTSLFLGFPMGAWFGVWLWAKLMRKTGFISGERVRKMSPRRYRL